MGQHKHNPTAIAAKNGELPETQRKKKLSKRQREALIRKRIQDMSGIPALMNEMGKPYLYI